MTVTTPLKVGDRAPDFAAPDGQGQMVKLQDLAGQWVVLYFYPRDNTPGCTQEACGFRDRHSDLTAMGVVVLGVSTDSAASHQKFTTKHQLTFPLLVDEDATLAKAYGVYGLKKFMGKEYLGITRSTFVIDPTGHLAKVYPKVKAAPHPAEVLADLQALQEAAGD